MTQHCKLCLSKIMDLPRRHIIDGNALLQALTGLPTMFGELTRKVFIALPRVKHADFVTDTCHHSIKSVEWLSRGSPKLYTASGSSTIISWDLSLQLFQQGKSQNSNSSSGRVTNIQVNCMSKDMCVVLTSSNEETTECQPVLEFTSSQEKADTRLILHCLHTATTTHTQTLWSALLILTYSCLWKSSR